MKFAKYLLLMKMTVPTAEVATDQHWLAYLDSVVVLSGGELARELWNRISSAVNMLPPDRVGTIPEGGFQFVWDRGEHYFEVDILLDSTMEWFYRNRRTDEVIGEDIPNGLITDVMKNKLSFIK